MHFLTGQGKSGSKAKQLLKMGLQAAVGTITNFGSNLNLKQAAILISNSWEVLNIRRADLATTIGTFFSTTLVSYPTAVTLLRLLHLSIAMLDDVDEGKTEMG